MEIAREFYSVPHRYVLGATESDFQQRGRQPKTAIDMVMSNLLAFERDENPATCRGRAVPGVRPVCLHEDYRLARADHVVEHQYPPEYFGQTHTANPASADAIRSAQDGMNRRGRQVQGQFSDPLEQVMCLAWRFAHDGRRCRRRWRSSRRTGSRWKHRRRCDG
jgi:hypothetical protein